MGGADGSFPYFISSFLAQRSAPDSWSCTSGGSARSTSGSLAGPRASTTSAPSARSRPGANLLAVVAAESAAAHEADDPRAIIRHGRIPRARAAESGSASSGSSTSSPCCRAPAGRSTGSTPTDYTCPARAGLTASRSWLAISPWGWDLLSPPHVPAYSTSWSRFTRCACSPDRHGARPSRTAQLVTPGSRVLVIAGHATSTTIPAPCPGHSPGQRSSHFAVRAERTPHRGLLPPRGPGPGPPVASLVHRAR